MNETRRRYAERFGATIHYVRGTRSLAVAGGLVLLLTVVETLLPDWLLPFLTGFALLLLVVGVLTLPRETAAAQQHLGAAVASDHAERVLARLLVLPVLLILLLLPRLFLAAYGIPHLTPTAGLLLPTLVRRLALVFLAAVLLVPILAFRQARRRLGAEPVHRPKDLDAADLEDDRRELLIACVVLVGVAWLVLLRAFWAPFSLLSWPPYLASLEGARGVAAIAFTLVVPTTLFAGTALFGELLRSARRLPVSPRRSRIQALVGLHLALLLIALALHAYDLLWIAKYQSASGL